MGDRRQTVVLGLVALLIGGIAIFSPMQTANAGGPQCPPDNVTVSLQHNKQANAIFDNTGSSVSISEITENCTPDDGPPTVTVTSVIRMPGCSDFILGPQDFTWGFGHTTLTLENTNCGDIFVEWHGDGNIGGSTNSNNSGDNCNDGNTYFHHKNKFTFASATLWVDGVVVDTSVDETDAVIARSITMEKKC